MANILAAVNNITEAVPAANSPVETLKSFIVNRVLSYHFSFKITYPVQSTLVPLGRIPVLGSNVLFYPGDEVDTFIGYKG